MLSFIYKSTDAHLLFFTFTFILTAKCNVLCPFTTELCTISTHNKLPWIYCTKQLWTRHSPDWQTISLLVPPDICSTWSRNAFTSAQILPLLLLMLLSARRRWGKFNLANKEGNWRKFIVFLIWFSEWQSTTASCWCLSTQKSEVSQIKYSCLYKDLHPEQPIFQLIEKKGTANIHTYIRGHLHSIVTFGTLILRL